MITSIGIGKFVFMYVDDNRPPKQMLYDARPQHKQSRHFKDRLKHLWQSAIEDTPSRKPLLVVEAYNSLRHEDVPRTFKKLGKSQACSKERVIDPTIH